MNNKRVDKVKLVRAMAQSRVFTQKKLSECSGVSRTTIGKWMRGETASLNALCKVANVLEVEVSDLLERNETSESTKKGGRRGCM